MDFPTVENCFCSFIIDNTSASVGVCFCFDALLPLRPLSFIILISFVSLGGNWRHPWLILVAQIFSHTFQFVLWSGNCAKFNSPWQTLHECFYARAFIFALSQCGVCSQLSSQLCEGACMHMSVRAPEGFSTEQTFCSWHQWAPASVVYGFGACSKTKASCSWWETPKIMPAQST